MKNIENNKVDQFGEDPLDRQFNIVMNDIVYFINTLLNVIAFYCAVSTVVIFDVHGISFLNHLIGTEDTITGIRGLARGTIGTLAFLTSGATFFLFQIKALKSHKVPYHKIIHFIIGAIPLVFGGVMWWGIGRTFPNGEEKAIQYAIAKNALLTFIYHFILVFEQYRNKRELPKYQQIKQIIERRTQ